MLRSRALARAKIRSVIGIDAIRDRGKPSLRCNCIEDGKQFVLAVIAPILVIHAISRIFQLTRFHKFVPRAGHAKETLHLFPIKRGIAGRNGRNRQRAITQRTMSSPSQIRRINAPRKRHDQRRECSQPVKQTLLFSRSHLSRWLTHPNLHQRAHQALSISQPEFTTIPGNNRSASFELNCVPPCRCCLWTLGVFRSGTGRFFRSRPFALNRAAAHHPDRKIHHLKSSNASTVPFSASVCNQCPTVS